MLRGREDEAIFDVKKWLSARKKTRKKEHSDDRDLVQGHKIIEKYNWSTQLWEYYTDEKFEFGVKERVSPDELYTLFHNGLLSAEPH